MAQRESKYVNVASRLASTARENPDGLAIVMPRGRNSAGKREYATITFRELEEDTNRIAAGLQAFGIGPGKRLVLMVRPSIDFVALVFALFKTGATTVLIDPGMGRKSLIRCLQEVDPDGFVAIPIVQAMRTVMRRKFPRAQLNVTVGRRWFWGGTTLTKLRRPTASGFRPVHTTAHDPAAIIFTTGSTGVPKGVLYPHGNFDHQVTEIRDFYRIQPGEIDLSGFPLFALFNTGMGVTTVIPDMDFTRPADVHPPHIVEALQDWKCTQAFGSPALWNKVAPYCEANNVTFPDLQRVLSAGAPVPPHVLARVKKLIAPAGDMHTPYGATEALPVASISATEVLGETAAQSRDGAGTCVGRHFPGIAWKIIAITDGPLATMDEVEEQPGGVIGELIVQGPVVTREYVTRLDANPLHKIADGDHVWHRMGDVGYLDERDRFWFCGRKAHRVQTQAGTLFTIPCEAIVNKHPRVFRSALVGVGPPGKQRPVLIVETWPDQPVTSPADERQLLDEVKALAAGHPLTAGIHDFLHHPKFPVDIRHNAKIFREKLAVWAADRLSVLSR
jgi:acyl-CoA synthetase (AMP-forming)/AMP-acid ligase II